MKPTDIDTLWVHVICAWLHPEVYFTSDEKMEPATGLLYIPPNSFKKVGLEYYQCNDTAMDKSVQVIIKLFFLLVNYRNVSFANEFVVLALSVASVPLTFMPHVLPELGTMWR